MLFTEIESGTQQTLSQLHYNIYKKDTTQGAYAVSNNDTSIKHIAVHLKNKRDIVLDGGGAQLMFHDRITPFLLDTCENVCLRNFSIDYDRPFYTQGTVLASDAASVTLRIHKEFPFRVEDKELIVTAPCWENNLQSGIMLFQEFDPHKKTLVYNAPVQIYRVGARAQIDPTAPMPMRILTAEQIAPDTIRLHGQEMCCYTVGNELVMTHEFRHNSGIVLHRCKNIRLENIHIIHTGAMGVVAQLSENITLEKVRVSLGAHKKRLVSTNCDATHFIACAGTISVRDCVLENMMDDGINVHGVYTRLERLVNETTLETKIMHFQQYGVPFYQKGDRVVITKGHSAEVKAELLVESAQMLREDIIQVSFVPQKSGASGIAVGDFLENKTATPELYVDGLKTGNNRPRGILATTPRKVLIENSTFYNSGYAIHIAGDTCFWYEAGGVEDITIQDCAFLNCNYNMGDYAIAITPEFESTPKQPWFHSNIRVRNNRFEGFTDGAILAQYVNGLTVAGNSYKKTEAYRKRIDTKKVTIKQCNAVACEGETEEQL